MAAGKTDAQPAAIGAPSLRTELALFSSTSRIKTMYWERPL